MEIGEFSLNAVHKTPPAPADFASLIIAQLAIGAAAIFARYGLNAGLSPASLSAWRLSVAALLLVAGISVSPLSAASSRPISRSTRFRLVIAGVFLGFHFVLWFASLQKLSVARSTLLVTSGPLWTGLGGWIFLKQRLGSRFWVGLSVALIGAYFVTGNGSGDQANVLAGDLLAVGGAIAVAAYLLLVQDLQQSIGTARTVAWTYTSAAFALWPFVFLTDWGASSLIPIGPTAWGSVIGMAILPQLVGHTLLNWSLKKFSAGVVAAATLLEPLFAALLAWCLFSESITTVQSVGAAVLLIGVGIAISTKENPPELST